MPGQYWTIKEAARALGVSEKTIRRRIWSGSIKADQVPGIWGIEYRITDLGEAPQLYNDLPIKEKGKPDEVAHTTDRESLDKEPSDNVHRERSYGPLDKTLDNIIVKKLNEPLDKALDIIKYLQEENERLAGQIGFLQAQLLEAQNKIRLLSGPKPKKSWWQRLFRRNAI